MSDWIDFLCTSPTAIRLQLRRADFTATGSDSSMLYAASEMSTGDSHCTHTHSTHTVPQAHCISIQNLLKFRMQTHWRRKTRNGGMQMVWRRKSRSQRRPESASQSGVRTPKRLNDFFRNMNNLIFLMTGWKVQSIY